MTPFVQLNRTFTDFTPNSTGEQENYSFLLGSFHRNAKTWADLLKNRCTVILAEAGSGKTMEMREKAIDLCRMGKVAFFCRLELLAENTLEKAIEIGNAHELNKWAQGTAHGYFFLDSVDEARLTKMADFEDAIIQLIDTIKSHQDRVTIIISTRPHAWQAQADPAMLSKRLALPSISETAEFESSSTDRYSFSELHEAYITPATKKESAQPIVIVQMIPLNEEQVRIFAIANGVADIADFMEAIERADADIFASRPADLPGLIQSWKENKRIGRYSQVVENNIKIKLSEENPTHGQHTPIAPNRAYQGAEALAAAVTLAKHTSIRLPDHPVDSALLEKSIDPQKVLSSWTPNEIQALLGRALFDEGLYGTVRFHHRTAREYLTARWFEYLLLKRKNRRQTERLFFAKPYATEPEAVVPTLKSIIGWLAAWDQNIRDRLLRVDPKVLLEFGDSSALDVSTREILLRDFAGRYGNRNYTPLRLDFREVRRLSDQRLAGAISNLLKKYRSHIDVSQLLLRILREGKICGCNSIALAIATAQTENVYTRALAVQVIGTTGTKAEKKRVARTILPSAAILDRSIISAAVETLWPDVLSDKDILKLIEMTPKPREFSFDSLEEEVARIIAQLEDENRLHCFLKKLLVLLQQPPLHNDVFPRISERFDWLLPLLWKVTKKWSTFPEQPETDPDFLSALSICGQADHLSRHTGEVHKEAFKLITDNAQIRHTLFWHECSQTRVSTDEPVTTWQSIIGIARLAGFDDADIEAFLHDLQQCTKPDDKLVALSVLASSLGRLETKEPLLEKIREALQGDATLEAALTEYLAPPTLAPQQIARQTLLMESERERERKRQEAERMRRDWIGDLKANPEKVGDLTTASEGKVRNNTILLIEEMGKQTRTKGTWSTWTTSRWQELVPDFGETVAESFRDFCQAFWRRYTPQLRSETVEDTGKIPWGVIVGLSGLSMEAQMNPNWATALTQTEADLATRYALWELNNFPPWFWLLYQTHSSTVQKVLLREIRWELDTTRSTDLFVYVLSRLRWTAETLGHKLRNDLIQILKTRPQPNVTSLTSALTVILRDPSPLPTRFQNAVSQHFEVATTDATKAIWLSVLLCVDASHAINALETWVGTGANAAAREARISLILNYLLGDRFHNLNSQHRDFMKVDVLLRLLKLAHFHVRIEDDLSHEGSYTPGVRDNAQQARGHLLELLVGIPGRPTFEALVALSNFSSHEYNKNHMLNLAEQRAEADVDFREWQPEAIVAFGLETEREPASQKDLFDIAISRLDDIKLDLEEGDESEASLWRKVRDEIELRRIVSNRLKHSSQNKYTIAPEEELADQTRTDIRLHHPDVDARIPIEIKIAGKWTTTQHRERLENQLIRQYMREAQYGIFLLINRGAQGDKKTWAIGKKKSDFSGLVQWLKNKTCPLIRKHKQVQGLEVIGIDLMLREKGAVEKKKQTVLKKNQRKNSTPSKHPTRSKPRSKSKA